MPKWCWTESDNDPMHCKQCDAANQQRKQTVTPNAWKLPTSKLKNNGADN
jgi:hypothetical protein